MKKRTLTISLIVLAIMLLVGIGYAGWVIGSATDAEEVGNFQAYAVSDSGVLEVTQVASQRVIFGKPNPLDPETPVWLSQTDVADEHLTVQFKVKWSGGAATFSLAHAAYKLTTGENPTEDPRTLDAKLIAAPTYDVVSGNGASIDQSGNLVLSSSYQANDEITISVTFGWGTSFGGQNPYTFFNGLTASATPDAAIKYSGSETSNQQVASNALTALDNLIKAESGYSELKFKVTVTKTA